MQNLKSLQEKLNHKLETAQSLVEYALILVLVAVVVIAVVSVFGETLYSTYTCVLISTRSVEGTDDVPAVRNVILYDADDNFDITPVSCGLRIAKSEIGNAVNIRAEMSPREVGSVLFQIEGPYSDESIENAVDYYVFGNSGSSVNDVDLPAGRYTLRITPYSDGGLGGTAGLTYVLTFTITDN